MGMRGKPSDIEADDDTRVYVCDINPAMLNVGKQRAQQRGKTFIGLCLKVNCDASWDVRFLHNKFRKSEHRNILQTVSDSFLKNETFLFIYFVLCSLPKCSFPPVSLPKCSSCCV